MTLPSQCGTVIIKYISDLYTNMLHSVIQKIGVLNKKLLIEHDRFH